MKDKLMRNEEITGMRVNMIEDKMGKAEAKKKAFEEEIERRMREEKERS